MRNFKLKNIIYLTVSTRTKEPKIEKLTPIMYAIDGLGSERMIEAKCLT